MFLCKQDAKATITGRIANDLIIEFTGSGKAVVNFGVMVNKKVGERDIKSYVPCVAWQNNAQFLVNNVTKGDIVEFDGFISGEFYEDQNHFNKLNVQIVVENVKLILEKKGADTNG